MISVVIPLYNKGEFIARAVDSVLAQSMGDWELIVVDDGSGDNGPAVVEGYRDARVRLVRQANAGVSAARNRGVQEARSQHVAFLDADDHWAPDHLASLMQAAQQLPDCVAWASAYWVVPESGQPRAIALPPQQIGRMVVMPDYFSQIRSHEHPIHSSAVMVRREVMLQLGGFPLGVTAGEDIIMWARLACAGPLGYVGKPSAYYMAPPVSQAVRAGFLRQPQTPDPVAAVLRELMQTSPLASSIRLFLGDWHRIRAMLFLERNERASAWRELWSAGGAGGWRARDGVSMILLLLPHGWRQRVLAWLRQVRQGRSSIEGTA
ncbi:MAG: glycosyltransferase family 2 protein [Acidobacteriota bacterium]